MVTWAREEMTHLLKQLRKRRALAVLCSLVARGVDTCSRGRRFDSESHRDFSGACRGVDQAFHPSGVGKIGSTGSTEVRAFGNLA